MLSAKISQVQATARKLVREMTDVKSGEQVLIVADYDSDQVTLDALTAAVSEVGGEPTITVMSPRAINGDPYPSIIGGAIQEADVIFGAATRDMIHALTWGPGGRIREARPWRLVDMTQATAEVMVRPAATGDYRELARIGDAVCSVVGAGERIRITSEIGTDITGLIRGGIAESGMPGVSAAGVNKGVAREPGTWCCFPDGEVYVLASGCVGENEGDAGGNIVFDTSMHMLGALREPVHCTVSRGKVTQIEGGFQAKELERILASVPNSNNIIELGSIATNPYARPHGESMYEDRKSLGTIHIALGNRYVDMYDAEGHFRPHFVHLDGVISRPSVYIDGSQVMDRGRLICLD